MKQYILLVLLASTFYAFTTDELNGQIISIKSTQNSNKPYLSHYAWRSADPTTSDNEQTRFEVTKIDSDNFYLKSLETGKLCGHSDIVNNQYDYFQCDNTNVDQFQLVSAGNSQYYLNTKDGRKLFYNSISNTSPFLMDSSVSNDSRKMQVIITKCSTNGEVFQAYGSDTCVSTCSTGYYKGTYFCEQCSDGCDECDSYNVCTSCENTHFFNGSECMSIGSFFTSEITLYSHRSNDYCSDTNNRIQCRANSVGQNEKFKFQRRNDGYISLIGGNNGLYCRNDISNDAKIRCDESSLVSSVYLKLYKNDDGSYSFLSTLNNKFASVQKSKKKHQIRFDTTSIGDHEKFTLNLL